jgi:hypothetical protein
MRGPFLPVIYTAALIFGSFLAAAQPTKTTQSAVKPDFYPSPPKGWSCKDMVAANKQKFKLCTPPAGTTAPPMHFWAPVK